MTQMDSEMSSKMIGLYNEKKSTVYFVQDSKIPSFPLKQQQQRDLLQQLVYIVQSSVNSIVTCMDQWGFTSCIHSSWDNNY